MSPSTSHNAAEMLASEATEAGEQTLIPGVRPVSIRERLDHLAAQPLTPRKPQKPLDIGLFDEATRDQLSLF
jgi:hypothetical protein